MATEKIEGAEETVAEKSVPQVYINQLSQHAGAEVTLRGWLYNLRSSGKLLFL